MLSIEICRIVKRSYKERKTAIFASVLCVVKALTLTGKAFLDLLYVSEFGEVIGGDISVKSRTESNRWLTRYVLAFSTKESFASQPTELFAAAGFEQKKYIYIHHTCIHDNTRRCAASTTVRGILGRLTVRASRAR